MVVKSSHGQRKRKNRKIKTKKESNPVKSNLDVSKSGTEQISQIRKSKVGLPQAQDAPLISRDQELFSPDADDDEGESPSYDETPTPGDTA